MTIGIVGAGISRPEDLQSATIPPAWRKATRNMILAVKSMEKALLQVPMLMERRRSSLGLVVGTNSGEIETSAEFITTLSRQGVARPLLFQNSLHNATAGFASIHFGLTGPAFTLSDRERTPTEGLALAEILLKENSCSAVIVTLVEVHKLMADYIQESVGEGACTLIFSRTDVADELRTPIYDLGEVGQPYFMNPKQMPLFDIGNSEFYRTALRLAGSRDS